MTDKEQIKCKYKFQDKEKFDGKTYCTCFCELCEDLPLCDDNCQIYEDFKQLTSKTQECEELKEELATYKKMLDNPEFRIALTDFKTGEREVWRKLGRKADRYRKALEEIEEYINQYEMLGKLNIKYILDIINKAKGEGNV